MSPFLPSGGCSSIRIVSCDAVSLPEGYKLIYLSKTYNTNFLAGNIKSDRTLVRSLRQPQYHTESSELWICHTRKASPSNRQRNSFVIAAANLKLRSISSASCHSYRMCDLLNSVGKAKTNNAIQIEIIKEQSARACFNEQGRDLPAIKAVMDFPFNHIRTWIFHE